MIGTQVGRYTIDQEIGDGGHAFVFLGSSPGTDEKVAIKMLRPSVADQDDLEKRFVLEVEALRSLEHPNIVGFKDYVFDNGYHYLILEYMDQGSVDDLLENGPMEYRYAIPIFHKVLLAMQFSHENNYLHRDIKPNNVLINTMGTPKVSDFGIARVMDASASRMTRPGYVLGTTVYMAPEVLANGKANFQSDIYALGVTFYEILTTRKPFEFSGDNEPLPKFARRVLRDAPPPLSTYVQNLPPQLERIVMKSITRDLKERYRTVAEFKKDLEKQFPEFVNRPVVIPKGTKIAMTGYVNTGELQDLMDTREGASDGKGLGAGLRAGIALVVLGGLGALTYMAKSLVPDRLAEVPDATIWGVGGVAALIFAALTFFLLPRRQAEASWSTAAQATPPRPMDDADDSEDGILSSSDLEGFSSSPGSHAPQPEIARAPAPPPPPSPPVPEVEDTIPFHNPSTKKMTPFKMTAESELQAYLVVTNGSDKGRRFGLRPVSRIGRDLRLDIRPHDQEISRHHALVAFDGDGFFCEDLGSTNGTFVNEQRLAGRIRLVPGDEIRVGSTVMRFEQGQPS